MEFEGHSSGKEGAAPVVRQVRSEKHEWTPPEGWTPDVLVWERDHHIYSRPLPGLVSFGLPFSLYLFCIVVFSRFITV